jgi:hypothetical protein
MPKRHETLVRIEGHVSRCAPTHYIHGVRARAARLLSILKMPHMVYTTSSLVHHGTSGQRGCIDGRAVGLLNVKHGAQMFGVRRTIAEGALSNAR